MLKLKKIQILGFKSFCDRTEVQLAGEGIAAIVGPNGCGKSNISDAITWVLGEQSAKSLRGIKMEDVIFAGTRDRKPTGMAEVSLTLVDPEIYRNISHNSQNDGSDPVASPRPTEPAGDWDEKAVRADAAQATEDAVAEAQPGVELEGDSAPAEPADFAAPEGLADAEDVVLKIRRRKFGRTPVQAGEITVTRRLFRTGDSEYLLNGKICRLRDIQDIFMGTGLGGESYAMIGQERIGQILSSKPLDRRGIIEEAAGITRFKTKKRLAELRLESARQNLSRVNDIFEEVTRQMGILKRQAAKAERYGALREELRGKLRVVLASRLAQMDGEQAAASAEISRLAGLIGAQTAQLESMDAEHSSGTAHGYQLDQQIRDATSRTNQTTVELERVVARLGSNADRIADLEHRLATGGDDLAGACGQLEGLAGEREQLRSFLENATAEAGASRDAAQARTSEAHESTRNVLAAEALAENQRRAALSAMQRVNNLRNEQSQAEAALASLETESERLANETRRAYEELEALGRQRGQARLSFEDVTERLKRLESEIAELRQTLASKQTQEQQSRRLGDQLRAELATLTGRRGSLEALIREHSYSTDTVRNIFRANAKREQQLSGRMAPVGTLADFLEVSGKYENVVDEFLRDELNYIVVKSWDAADEGVRMLHSGVAGRATFLVHPDDSQATFPFAEGMRSSAEPNREGVVPLKDCIRVLDGFGRSLEVILPKLREGFVAPDSSTARSLALSNPQAFFLSPSGETFHNVTVTGGRPRTQGPLALKRELAEVQANIEAAERELAQAETGTQVLIREIADLTSALDGRNHERRDAERESANSGAALRQMESETARIERRLQEWQLAAERNRDQRGVRQDLIARKRDEAAQHEGEREKIEAQVAALTDKIAALRADRERLQAAASAANAALAGLEERRRNADANFAQTDRLFNAQSQRIAQLEQQINSAGQEKQRRETETVELTGQRTELTEMRKQSIAEGETLTAEAAALRASMAELDGKLRALRHETEGLRDQRATLSARIAKLSSDIEHMEAACINDLSVEPAALREDASIERITEAAALHYEDETARALKSRMEAMGPVNMMALDEFNETATRHGFLETQRKDLLDSIENTQASIKEIDEVSRVKFDEAFRIINENFSKTFTRLFGGGQALMKLTDELNSAESGIDIIASPPGKKLQNVLLLSGGEKALTALSLLVGIFHFQPAPFCVLDEVDAPLDETNVGRFARLISEMSATTQFVVITHSKRTMEQADVMYGVTMQEPGVSKIVSVSLGGRSRGREARAA